MKLSGILWRLLPLAVFCDFRCCLPALNSRLPARNLTAHDTDNKIQQRRGHRIIGIPQHIKRQVRSNKHNPPVKKNDGGSEDAGLSLLKLQHPHQAANFTQFVRRNSKRQRNIPSAKTSKSLQIELTLQHDKNQVRRQGRRKYIKKSWLRKLTKTAPQIQIAEKLKHTSSTITTLPAGPVADPTLSNSSTTVQNRGTIDPVSILPDTSLPTSGTMFSIDSDSANKSVSLTASISMDDSSITLHNVTMKSIISTDDNISTYNKSASTANTVTQTVAYDVITSTGDDVLTKEPSKSTEDYTTAKSRTTTPDYYDYYFYPFYSDNNTYFEEDYENGNLGNYNGTNYPDDYYEDDYAGDYYDENNNLDVDTNQAYDQDNADYYYYLDYNRHSRKLKPKSAHKILRSKFEKNNIRRVNEKAINDLDTKANTF